MNLVLEILQLLTDEIAYDLRLEVLTVLWAWNLCGQCCLYWGDALSALWGCSQFKWRDTASPGACTWRFIIIVSLSSVTTSSWCIHRITGGSYIRTGTVLIHWRQEWAGEVSIITTSSDKSWWSLCIWEIMQNIFLNGKELCTNVMNSACAGLCTNIIFYPVTCKIVEWRSVVKGGKVGWFVNHNPE